MLGFRDVGGCISGSLRRLATRAGPDTRRGEGPGALSRIVRAPALGAGLRRPQAKALAGGAGRATARASTSTALWTGNCGRVGDFDWRCGTAIPRARAAADASERRPRQKGYGLPVSRTPGPPRAFAGMKPTPASSSVRRIASAFPAVIDGIPSCSSALRTVATPIPARRASSSALHRSIARAALI